jgi:Domain of unknown function (DUF4159)
MNAAPEPLTSPRRPIIQVILAWAHGVRYVALSGVLHTILVIILGGTVLYRHYAEPPEFTAAQDGFITEDIPLPVPQESIGIQNPDLSQTATASTAAASTAMASTTAAQMASITTTAPATNSFTMSAVPAPNISLNPTQSAQAVLPSAIVGAGLSKGQASRIAAFTGRWSKGGTSMMGQPLKSRAFEFTAYLATYAGGDWDSTVWLDGETVRGGSLHNLLYIISRLSHQKIHADPQPIPLDLASNEIFEKKPPFIWFTGHRDFVLTDQEVVNLGEYLRSGGCIWGDSSLPGNRSRFDIAFRREMLRILPEVNQKWEPLPANHPIYTNTYYQEIKGVVPGMNFYHEPIYGLKGFANEIAILYTANDYGDMWQFGLDEKGDFDLSRDDKRRFVAINEPMWHRRNLYFRNVEPKALMDTYKFGTNIIIHLLTRWEAHVRFAPTVMRSP